MDFKSIGKQILIEFSGPFFLASGWALFVWITSPEIDQTVTNSIKTFLSAFFFTSWMLAQWFRISKQQKMEGGLSSIETKVKLLLSELEDSSIRMIGSSIGGDSFCELIPVPTTILFGQDFALLHHGKFPLYDVNVRIVDLERLKAIGNKANEENVFDFPILIPGHATTIKTRYLVNIAHDRPCHLNIFVTARNGSTLQMLQMQIVNGHLKGASNIERDGKVIYEAAAVEYPKTETGNVNWDEHLADPKFRFNYKQDIF